jgi:hypothetical protein
LCNTLIKAGVLNQQSEKMALVPSLAPILGDPFLTDVERSLNRALQPFFSGGTSAVGFPGALATMPMPGALFDVKETDHSYQLIAGKQAGDDEGSLEKIFDTFRRL